MTLKQLSVVALSALMAVVSSPALPESASVTIPLAPVDLCGAKLFPADASAYTGGPPVYIGHTADLERLTRAHPEDAAELRRALDALVNRSDDEVARVMIVELRDLNPTVSSDIMLTSWPPQHELTLTVNKHLYRVGLIPRYEVRAIALPNCDSRKYPEEVSDSDRTSSLHKELTEELRAQIREEARRLERLKAYQ